jgi:hypothetical protein
MLRKHSFYGMLIIITIYGMFVNRQLTAVYGLSVTQIQEVLYCMDFVCIVIHALLRYGNTTSE